MKKAVLEIIKKLQQTAAGKKMTPKQLESRAKMDYKDTQDYKARIAKEDKSFSNQMNRELAAKQNLKDPKNKAMLNAKEREMEKYIPGYKGKTYKKGGKVKKMQEGGMAAGNTQAEIEKLNQRIEVLRQQAAAQARAVPQRSRLGGVPGDMRALAPQGGASLGGMKKGGKVKKMAKGGKVYCKDGCAVRGKTKGKLI